MKGLTHYLKNSNRGDISKENRFSLGDILTKEFIQDLIERRQLESVFYEAKSMPEKWNAIRMIYDNAMPAIMDAAARSRRGMVDPYFIDWVREFSPIERDAWHSIRYFGVPFYPQFPVSRYFIDFANPALKIGLEMDGKDYHNIKKDRTRDTELYKLGWRIFRIPGSQCHTEYKNLYEIEEMQSDYATEYEVNKELENYFNNTSDGVIKAISIVYFDGSYSQHGWYALETLKRHRLIDFPICWQGYED